jgi:tetratricopeptide (TPR) repeat protein
LTVLGEASTRLGHAAEAETFFKRALELDSHDVYVLCSYADLLLDQDRPKEVITLLRDGLRADGQLLRLALAESQLKPSPAALDAHVKTLATRFEEGHLRGDFVHLREEARFALYLRASPQEALRLALANWQVQREPADMRILLESAFASHDSGAAGPALDFIRHSHIQDLRLKKLATSLGPLL